MRDMRHAAVSIREKKERRACARRRKAHGRNEEGGENACDLEGAQATRHGTPREAFLDVIPVGCDIVASTLGLLAIIASQLRASLTD